MAPLQQVRFGCYRTVARDHLVYVIFERLPDGLLPFDQAAAARVVDKREAVHKKIAGVQDALRREIHEGVPIRVPPAKVPRADFLASQKDLGLIAKCNSRKAGHLSGDHVGPRVLMRDNIHRCRHRQQRLVAAGVIAVLVRVQNIADRLVGNRFHLGQNVRGVLREFIVHEDYPFAGRQHRDIAAIADDHVQILGDLLHGQRLSLRRLRPEDG